MLGGAVDAHFRRCPQPRHRGGIDDGTTALGQQQGQLVLHAQPHTLDVDAHDGVELRLATLGQTALLDLDASIVVGVVQPAIGGYQPFMQLAHIGLPGHVAGDEHRIAARIVDQAHRGFAADRVEVGHHHFQAFTGKSQRRRPANTRSAAGDQGYLAGKGHAHRLLLTRPFVISQPSIVSAQPSWAASSGQRLVYHAYQ
ncbi:hypothetical protein D3C76_762750 [compost metagenome]